MRNSTCRRVWSGQIASLTLLDHRTISPAGSEACFPMLSSICLELTTRDGTSRLLSIQVQVRVQVAYKYLLQVQVQVHKPTLAMQMKLNKINESWLS